MIQQGHKCVVLKIMQQNLKVLKKNATKQEYKGQYWIQDPTRAQVCSTQDNATKSKST